MEEILLTVKHITVFILVFSVVSNLFARSKYQKYFGFVEGIIIIILIMTPLLTKFTDEHFLDESLEKNNIRMEKNTFDDELRMIGEKREKMLQEAWREEGDEGTSE